MAHKFRLSLLAYNLTFANSKMTCIINTKNEKKKKKETEILSPGKR